jgi:hypothetical protein
MGPPERGRRWRAQCNVWIAHKLPDENPVAPPCCMMIVEPLSEEAREQHREFRFGRLPHLSLSPNKLGAQSF